MVNIGFIGDFRCQKAKGKPLSHKSQTTTLPDQLKDVFVSQFKVHSHGFVIFPLVAAIQKDK